MPRVPKVPVRVPGAGCRCDALCGRCAALPLPGGRFRMVYERPVEPPRDEDLAAFLHRPRLFFRFTETTAVPTTPTNNVLSKARTFAVSQSAA